MNKFLYIAVGFLFTLFILPVQSYASDLEAYQGGGTDAKVLLVLDASGSMLLQDHKDGGQVIDYSETRMATLYSALAEVFRTDGVLYNDPNLSVGFTYFGGVMGSGIKFPVSSLSLPANELIAEIPETSDETVRDVILSMVDGIFPRDSELYDPSGFDIENAQLWNEPYGYIYMADVPETDIPYATIDWEWTKENGNDGLPPFWSGQHPAEPKDEDGDLIDPVPPGGSAWTSSNLPIAWVQMCPEPPAFSGTYVELTYGTPPYTTTDYEEFTGCDTNGDYWDPDRCKVGYQYLGEDGSFPGFEDPEDNGIPIDKFDEDGNPAIPQWRMGGFPGEWDSCIPGTPTVVHAYHNSYFTLYNDTRELLTPTVDALFEATRYFRGERVHYGSRDFFPPWNNQKSRYVNILEPSYDYPDGDFDAPEVSLPLKNGFPGDLELLGVTDKSIFTNKVDSQDKMTGGLWGWRAANPLTYADADGGNDGPRRTYLPISTWSSGDSAATEEEDKHLLKNSIFKYDCDYRIGSTKSKDDKHGHYEYAQWSYLFNSFYGCNLVDGDQLFEYPTVTSAADLESIRYGGSIAGVSYKGDDVKNRAVGNTLIGGNLDNPGDGPNPPNGKKADVYDAPANDKLACEWKYQYQAYCPDSEVTGDGTSSSTNDGCSKDLVVTSHYERVCDFRYQSAKHYESPIGECSNSSIILISDGHPTANTVDNNNYIYGAGNAGETEPDLKLDELFASNIRAHNVRMDTPGLIRDLVAKESCEDIFSGLGDPMDLEPDQVTEIVRHEINKSGACAYELAAYLKETNQRPGSSQIGTVTTNTVGFQLSETDPALTFLQKLAEKGGGQYANANNEAQLVAAITAMISASTKDSADTGGVAFSLDSSTLTSAREIYAPVFKSTQNPTWDANVKGYYLYAQEASEETFLVSNKNEVPVTGRSFWFDDSGVVNSNAKVLVGGLNYAFLPAETHNSILASDTSPDIDPADRHTWSYPSHLTAGRQDKIYVEREVWTDQKWDYLREVPRERLGFPAATDEKMAEVLDFTYAQPMGDSLHSKPVTVEFDGNKYLIVVSNSGLLQSFKLNKSEAGDYHSVKPTEVAAWMPHSLTKNVGKLYREKPDHIYGLDGPLRIWSPTVTNSAGDEVKKTYAYFGMRRGGSSYYMLDITNPGDITVVWRIDGGGENTNPFKRLGDTWSPITLFKVNDTASTITISGETVTLDGTYAAVFGGGYNDSTEDDQLLPRYAATRDDPNHSGSHNDTYNRAGRGLFVIDPLTGSLHRSFGGGASFFSENVTKMRYGVPAEIRAIDADGDGYGDRLYFGDMGGQIWRLDIDGSLALNNEEAYNVKLLADFGINLDSAADSTAEEILADNQKNHRRFYTAPSVAYTENGDLAIAIGSGYRAHPLNGVSRQASPGLDANGDDLLGELYPVIEDRFYLLKDSSLALKDPANATTVTVDQSNAFDESDLYDATANLAGSTNDSVRATALASIANASGWFIQLKESSDGFVGEKVLGSPVIFRNVISFTTTIPEGEGEACVFTPTSNRFYSINLSNGAPSGVITETPDPENEPDVTIPVTDTRWVEIETTDAIVDSVDIVSMGDDPTDTAGTGGTGTGTVGDPDDSSQQSCVKFFTKTAEMAKMCFEPSKIFWKETGRDEVDCRFNDEGC